MTFRGETRVRTSPETGGQSVCSDGPQAVSYFTFIFTLNIVRKLRFM